ncbi:MAG: DNA polymerase III subunit gamma/tau [Bacteroidetes bacterium]|nr:MAG: DNA polymerase III subunit gamma/tau [Bacteroidota bacterium]
MEKYIVSARKYRPQTFDTVVGQQSITNTLKNAIKTGHLAQAFLFCGPRGVGKTTCARILAKTINCLNIQDNIEACNECESCKSFNQGQSLNIFELDAASNNSVDDIRNLIDQVRFAPQIGTKKVYIIDEVHMLSQAAFNAFLKTLEEPPPHAIFILATTEKHKIIPTILSRCQIFDFKRIGISDIVAHLQKIAQKEGIEAEAEALHVIAEKADGALRDALSIFDQIVTFCGNKITYQDVIKNLNILDYDYYFKITEANLQQNNAEILLILNEILSKGFDGHNFIVGLAEHYRNLLIVKNPQTAQLLEVSDSVRKKYINQSQKTPDKFLLNAIEYCSQADQQYKTAKNQRLLLEITLLKINALIGKLQKKKPLINSGEEKSKSTNVVNSSDSVNFVSEQPEKYTLKDKHEKAKPLSEKQAEVSKTPLPKTNGGLVKGVLGKAMGKQSSDENGDNEDSILEPEITNKFTQEQLLECWNTFAEKLRTEGKESLYSSFNLHQPRLKENFVIEVVFGNNLQIKQFNDVKPDLLSFLKEKLNNNIIAFELKTDKTKQTTKAFTNKEKCKQLIKKNPNVKNLIDKLDLEIS